MLYEVITVFVRDVGGQAEKANMLGLHQPPSIVPHLLGCGDRNAADRPRDDRRKRTRKPPEDTGGSGMGVPPVTGKSLVAAVSAQRHGDAGSRVLAQVPGWQGRRVRERFST